jgi:AcrR family transcriptional regulator
LFPVISDDETDSHSQEVLMGGKSLVRSKAQPKRTLRIVDKKPDSVGGSSGSEESPAMRLVLAATRLFNENSIHSTGIDRIIAEAGVARRTLYNQFGSKEGLIRAVMQRESNAWFEWLDSELTPADVRDPRQRIIRFFALLGKWFSRSDFKGCSFINAVGEHPLDNCVRPIAKAHRQANFEYIRGLLGGSKISNLDKVADQIAILADGATVTAMVTGNHTTAETAAHAALAVMDVAERRVGVQNWG